MRSSNHDVQVLNRLIESTIDSAHGYREASREASGPRFASTFASRAQERAQVAQLLQRQVRALGGQADTESSVLARTRRVFVDLRSSLGAGDAAVVSEIERGEDYIQTRFEHALRDQALSLPTRSVIMQAYVSVKIGHEQMRDLKYALYRRP